MHRSARDDGRSALVHLVCGRRRLVVIHLTAVMQLLTGIDGSNVVIEGSLDIGEHGMEAYPDFASAK